MPLIVVLVGGLINGSFAQSRYDSAYERMAKGCPEHLVVFTDRSLYAVNESILFSALLQSGKEACQGIGSAVLYAELVSSTGTAVNRGKFLIKESWSAGHLSIPSTLGSGIYYLRCYTRWMRNFGSRDFAYQPIRVVNPYSSDFEVDKPEPGKNGLIALHKGARIVTPSPARGSYLAGERVEVELSLKEGSNTPIQHACITVVPSGAIETSVFNYRVDSEPGEPAPFQFNFLPETDGTTISGIVIEPNKQKAASDTRIHFSILGEEPAYFVTLSDLEGRFQIKTPLRMGDQEMFVVPEYQHAYPIEVHIDNDFSSEPLPFHPGSFMLHQDEQTLASRMSLHMQLRRTFLPDSGIDSTILTKQADPVPFYGTPEISVMIDEFINLPNMEEVVENLIPNTYVIHREGRTHFMIKSENPLISMFPMLILIDHIPVFDMEVIMAIPPSKIDHIDVIPEVFIKGSVKYGGIISFTSRQGDLAGIKLPEGSYFFDYNALQPPTKAVDTKFSGPGKIPDTRNTLFWMNHLELQRNSSSKVRFQAASVPGTYVILFRGVSSDGNIVYGLDSFDVE